MTDDSGHLQADKIKGYVSMKGYKLISDENVNPGKYGFKLLHEHEKPHYFSSEDPIVVRDWMKSLMKATIGRDHSCECCMSVRGGMYADFAFLLQSQSSRLITTRPFHSKRLNA